MSLLFCVTPKQFAGHIQLPRLCGYRCLYCAFDEKNPVSQYIRQNGNKLLFFESGFYLCIPFQIHQYGRSFLQKRTSQHLNIKKSANSIYKRLLTDFERIGFGEVFAQTADLVFEFKPLCFARRNTG